MKQGVVVAKDTEKTRVGLVLVTVLLCFCLSGDSSQLGWIFGTAGSRKGEDWLQAGMRRFRHDTDSPGGSRSWGLRLAVDP